MDKNLQVIEQQTFPNYIHHISVNDYGNCIRIMEKSGRAYATMYWYRDDKNIMYFSDLNVSPEFRELGFGSDLLSICENIGKNMGFTKSCLLVKEDSFVKNMYERKSYKFLKNDSEKEGYVWMIKDLL